MAEISKGQAKTVDPHDYCRSTESASISLDPLFGNEKQTRRSPAIPTRLFAKKPDPGRPSRRLVDALLQLIPAVAKISNKRVWKTVWLSQ
jgi:hypothetical protein